MRDPDRDGRGDDRLRVGRRPFLQSVGAVGAAGGIGTITADDVRADTPSEWASGGDAYYQTLVDDLQNGLGLPAAEFVFDNTESGTMSSDAVFTENSNGTTESLDVSGDGVPFSEATRFDVTSDPENDWDVQFRADIDESFSSGDVMLAVAYLRSSSESPAASFVAVDAGEYGNDAAGNSSPAIAAEWERHYFPVEFSNDTDAGNAYVQFQLGQQQQTVDVGGFALLDFGTNADAGNLPSGAAGGTLGPYYETLRSDVTGMGLPEPEFEFGTTESGVRSSDAVFTENPNGTTDSLDVSGDGVPFSEATRFDVTSDPENDWDVQFRGNIPDSISSGDVMLAVAYLRSSSESPAASFAAVDAGEYGNDAAGNTSPTIAAEWERHYFPIEFSNDTDAGNAYVQLQLGFKQQTVDVGGFALLDFSGTGASVGDLPSGAASLTGPYYRTLSDDLTALGLPEPGFVYSNTESGTWDAYQFGVGEYGTVDGIDVSGDGVPFAQASRVSINGSQENDYNANLRADVQDMPVEQGDVFLGVAYLRGPDGGAQVTYAAQEASDGFDNWANSTSPSIGSEWDRYYFPIRFGAGADAGNWWTEFWLAYEEQTIDIGGLALLDYSDADVTVDDLPAGPASEIGGGSGGDGPEEWPQTDDPYYSGLIDYLQELQLAPGRLLYANNEADAFANFALDGGEVDKATRSSLEVGDDVPFSQATRVEVSEAGTNAYSVNLKGVIENEGVSEGDVLLGVAYLRAPDGDGQITYKVSENSTYGNYVINPGPPLNSEWQRYFFPISFDASYEAGNWWTEIWLAAQAQTVDIGGLAVFNFEGNNSVEALPQWEQSADPGWEDEADQRIQEHRTAEMTVEVVDEDGDPVEGADVSVAMQEHEFGFGSMVSAPELQNTEEGDPYRENRKELFNTGVLENYHKWNLWEGNQDTADAAVDWMEDQDWYVRGHVCLWADVSAAAVPDDIVDAMGWDSEAEEVVPSEADSEYVRNETTAHVEDIISYYGDRVDEWEVVNEVIPVPGFVRAIHGDEVEPVDAPVFGEWFSTARDAGPDDQLLGINDYNTIEGPYSGRRDSYEQQIQTIKDTDAGLDFVGLQSHFSQSSSLLPSEVMTALDRYAENDVRLRITEFDMSDDTWPEEDKATFFYQFLKTVFSHPAVDEFVVWGLIDTLHWRDDAPFYAAGWEEKPALDRYRDLVFDQWWTEESGTTDASGAYSLRGFRGEYAVDVSYEEQLVSTTTTLSDGGTSLEISLDGDVSDGESGEGEGDGGGSSGPTADAGSDQRVRPGERVTLDGGGSTGKGLDYEWFQMYDSTTDDPAVSLTGKKTARASFTAPEVDETRELDFRLEVTDSSGNTDQDTVDVVVEGSSTSTPTATPTDSPTATPTDSPTPTATETATPTATPTDSPTPTPTATETATPTASPTGTPTPTDSGPEPMTTAPEAEEDAPATGTTSGDGAGLGIVSTVATLGGLASVTKYLMDDDEDDA
ncbi:endo-1,4-beta-xylanase [Halosimplex salinum]|uniref:endo-1,4-beta-xylanase n=1 Tax=Halosimplex salinum TaxID=1710538 RepID=UPI0013DE2336|nr:endo-1,4-beta-xylanase [Halosimplex salinum]